MTSIDVLIYGFLMGGVTGLAIGLIPMAIGFSKKNKNLGIISLIITGISGGLLGALLAIPVAILCTVIIFMKSKEAKKCPYCAESINVNAVVCKHCKETIQ